MSNKSAMAQMDLASILHPTTDLFSHQEAGPTIFERGEGIRVWDSNGKEYIEGMAGLWCTAVGHGNEELAKTAYEQMKKLSFCTLFAGRSHEPAIKLSDKLVKLSKFAGGKVFLGTSGSDANDTQIKIMRYYNNALGRPNKKRIISRENAYHGVSLAAASLTGLGAFHKGFDLPDTSVLRAECPHYYRYAEPGETEEEYSDRLAKNLETLIINNNPDTIAAMIAEPVIGSGGILVPPKGYFDKIQKVLTKYDIFLIADEVICGFGRTGEVFGHQAVGMVPTSLSLAKQLSSGYQPISAVVIPDFINDVLVDASKKNGVFAHGYTYSGHPVAAAVALRNLELFEELDLYNHARKMGEYLQKKFSEITDHPLVGEAGGIGMLGAVQIVKNKDSKELFGKDISAGKYCAKRCIENGLLTRSSADDRLAFCPPLIATESDIDEIFDKIELSLRETETYIDEC
jgi:4-aminobutyrate---pyruvate transaminase